MKTLLRLLPIPVLLLAACKDELVCARGETACGGHCVSLLADAANCGACGTACGANEVCGAGACTCAAGATACGDACAVLESDPGHCGACDTACAAADVCSLSQCAAACANGLTACDRACVDLSADRFHCGACGTACAEGESCRDGACRADLQVACYVTNDVRAVTLELAPAGAARATGQGPIALAIQSGTVYAATSLGASITALPLDARLPGKDQPLEGSDFENVVAHDGLLFIANSGRGTILVYDPARALVLDEVVLGTPDANPRGIAFDGTRAYVALYGMNESTGGQGIAILDLSGLAACAAATGGTRPDCATLEKTLDLRAAPGASDAPGLPFPSEVVVHRGRVYVTLANLRKPAGSTFYTEPAGSGRLAVVDPSRSDKLSIYPLGACRNPGAAAVDGEALWVSCSDAAAPGLLRVDVSGAAPVAATDLFAVPIGAPGALAFCGGMGYVTDQWSGNVVRFDPQFATAPVAAEACPVSDAGWAWAADVACAE